MFSKIRSLIFKLDPESAHDLAIKALKFNPIPQDKIKNNNLIQTEIYTVGKENGYKENLRDWFRLIYEVVFGDENGPRMGFFISFFGVKETQQLIKDKIN